MSTIHAVKCYDEDSGLTIRLYDEGDCGYPCTNMAKSPTSSSRSDLEWEEVI